jgi:hypothetical protein
MAEAEFGDRALAIELHSSGSACGGPEARRARQDSRPFPEASRRSLHPAGAGTKARVGVFSASRERAEEVLGDGRTAHEDLRNDWKARGRLICVRDMEGRLFTDTLGPNDNAEYVARRLLREKHGRHGAFHGPIRYPASYH